MTKLDEIQEWRNQWANAQLSYNVLLKKYRSNPNIINKINIFLLNRVMKKLKNNIEYEIKQIREREY